MGLELCSIVQIIACLTFNQLKKRFESKTACSFGSKWNTQQLTLIVLGVGGNEQCDAKKYQKLHVFLHYNTALL